MNLRISALLPYLRLVAGALPLIVACTNLSAQGAGGNAQIVVRELSSPDARSATPFGAIVGVRPLSNGSVLVSDGVRYQVVMLDKTLTARTVVVDSVETGGVDYGRAATHIIPYTSDTTLFADRKSSTFSVIDPRGQIVRTYSLPRPGDLPGISMFSGGGDARGRLIYRGTQLPDPASPTPVALRAIIPPDSAPIVRADFETRAIDTIVRVKVAGSVRATAEAGVSATVYTLTMKPNVAVDDWTLLSDGSVAVVRGHDYHVEIFHPDGKRTVGPKLPFDWKQLTEGDKQQLIDSTQAVLEKQRIESPNSITQPREAGGARMGFRQGTVTITRKVVPAAEIADYWPPIRYGAAKADADGNLWILPTTSAQSKAGELVYDVVNNRGELLHRVRMPVGRSVAGFDVGGVVYLMSRDTNKLWFLERTKLNH
jgi:hypothetical protein